MPLQFETVIFASVRDYNISVHYSIFVLFLSVFVQPFVICVALSSRFSGTGGRFCGTSKPPVQEWSQQVEGDHSVHVPECKNASS